MKFFSAVVCVVLSVILGDHITFGQLPPRLSIPGAVLVGQARPAPFRQQRIHGDGGPVPRLRRPIPNAAPAPIRPVVEEAEEPPASPANNNFDDEVSKLGISALQSAVRQAAAPEEETPRPVHFRPERPVPVLRENIREGPPPPRPAPVLRQEQRENIPRQLLRQEPREDLPVPVRQPQPVRHSQ
ncbi:formin-like protein 8, partial [Asbolus verrucosus]